MAKLTQWLNADPSGWLLSEGAPYMRYRTLVDLLGLVDPAQDTLEDLCLRRWYESDLRAVSFGEVDFPGVDRSQAGSVC